MDTFEIYQMFSLSIIIDMKGGDNMTKREKLLYFIILLLFIVIFIILLK